MRYLWDDSFAPPHFTPHFFSNLANQFWPFTIQCSTLWRVAYSQRWVLRKSATSFILKICYIRYYEDTSLNTKNLKVCVIRYQTHLCYTNILTVNPSLPQGCEIKPKEKGTIVTASRLNNSTVQKPQKTWCLRSDHRASFSCFNYLPFSLLVRMVILWSFGYEKKTKNLPSTFGRNLIMSMGESNMGQRPFFSVADF